MTTLTKEAHEARQRLLTIVGVGLAMFLGALDQTIVSTAMPRVVTDLGGLDRYTWITTIYLLFSTILVPIYGKLSDMVSRKSLELWSVSVFLVGSALCGMAGEWGSLPLIGDGMNQLILFRCVQGIGGAGVFSLAFIIVSDLYPPKERGKIAGLFGAVFGLSSVLGPLVGGFLTDNAGGWITHIEGWRWVFYVNLPIGILAIWFIAAKMPKFAPKDESKKIDPLSAALLALAFVPLILGLQLDKNAHPWDSPLILSLLIGGGAFMALWIWHSLRAEHPIMDLRLFKNKVFRTGTTAMFFYGAAFLGTVIFLPMYMVFVQGVSATASGASIIPLSFGLIAGASGSGLLSSKLGRYKALLIVGGVLSVGASILLTTLGVDSPYWLVILYMVLLGFAMGPAQSLFTIAIQNTLPPQEMGQGTSAIQFSRQIGSTAGSAVMGVVFSAALAAGFAANMPAQAGGGGSPLEGMSQVQMMTMGEKEIKAKVVAGFEADYLPLLDKLFDGATDEQAAAAKAISAALDNPMIPSEAKDQIKGMIAMATAAPSGAPSGMAAGKPSAARIAAMKAAAAKASAGSGQPPVAPDPAQLAAIKAAAKEKAVAGFKQFFAAIAETIWTGVKKTFNDSIHQVWIIGIVIMTLNFLATLFVPALKLKGKEEMARNGMGGAAAL